MRTRDYRLLHLFAQVEEAGSLTRAAEQLHVSIPVLSEALSDLEALLNCTLVSRGPRRFALTETGADVLRHAQSMRAHALEAMRVNEELDGDLKGTVRMTLSVELALKWLPPLIESFNAANPEVVVEVVADDRTVDLASSGTELAIRADWVENIGRPEPTLSHVPLAVVAAPGLRQQRPLPFIAFSWQRELLETSSLGVGGTRRIPVRVVRVVNNSLVAHEMCRQGAGACLLMNPTILDDIDEGRLEVLHARRNFGFVELRHMFRDPQPSRLARALSKHLSD